MPSCSECEVHLWTIPLETTQAERQRLTALLDADEQARMMRFRFPADRSKFAIAHGALREVLATYTNGDPRGLRFRAGLHGKPALDPPVVHFNLSHSGQLALVAVASDREVGVDVECLRDDLEVLEIARRFFAPDEAARIESLSGSERTLLFFTMWTRKEAVVKAQGLDLGSVLDKSENDWNDWGIQSFDPRENYVAAVAAQGSGWTLCNIAHGSAWS